MIHEGLLHRMQRVAIRQAFDRANFLACRLHGKHQARAHRLAVHDHSAGAANAVLAADMRTGLPAIIADRVHQCAPRLDLNRMIAAVDTEADSGFCGHAIISSAHPRESGDPERHILSTSFYAPRFPLTRE